MSGFEPLAPGPAQFPKFFDFVKALACALAFPLFFSACAGTQKSEEAVLLDPSAEILIAGRTDSVPEQFSGRDSWANYHYAIEAIDNENWLLASHYLDLSLKNLIAERKDSTLSTAADSAYNAQILESIMGAYDAIYPQLAELGHSAEGWTPYEMSLEGIEPADELADSTELEVIENFLDTLDLGQFTLPVELNDRVLQEIYYFTERVPSFIKASLNRKTAYDSLIYGVLDEYEMPRDLIYLSLVESGFKVRAYSRAKASGLWQFIPATGERFGLRSDFWVDMRRNPEKATRAAAAYLTYLYREFGDWLMAMAAYNCGEGRVRRVIKELKADTTRDSTQAITYWDLPLPKETMHYVPRILAAMIIGHFPEHYGIEVERTYLPEFDTVTVTDPVPLSEIAKAVSISEDSVKALNMELIKWSTPPDVTSYTLRVPPGTRETFLLAYAKMDRSKFPRWHYHKVKKGEYLGLISKKYGVSIADIQAANNMKKSTSLKAGQELLIPLPPSSSGGTQAKKVASKAPKKTRTYTVQEGENEAAVARRFGISKKDLRAWNKLAEADSVKTGMTLFVAEPMEGEVPVPPPPKLENGTYEVREGDSYLSIAQTFGVSPIALLELNNGRHERLTVGQRIKVPEPEKKAKTSKKSDKKKTEKTAKAAEKKPETYTVRSGDNLYAISRRTGVSVANLQKWNGIGDDGKIQPGQKLYLQAPKAAESSKASSSKTAKASKKTHKVAKGESLWDISKKYGVTIDDLVKWNKLSGTRIQAGESLVVEGP